MGICGANYAITVDAGERHLTSDVFVGQSNDHPVFGRVVFVLILNGQPFAGIIVSFTFTTPLEFDLVPLKVLLVLHNFHETL